MRSGHTLLRDQFHPFPKKHSHSVDLFSFFHFAGESFFHFAEECIKGD